jgi:hypothetical protein
MGLYSRMRVKITAASDIRTAWRIKPVTVRRRYSGWKVTMRTLTFLLMRAYGRIWRCLRGWTRMSANIPAAKLIAFSAGPMFTSLAGLLITTFYRSPKRRR